MATVEFFPQRAILNKTKASLEELQRSLDERLKVMGEDMDKITAEQEKVARGGDTVVARDQNNTKLQSQSTSLRISWSMSYIRYCRRL